MAYCAGDHLVSPRILYHHHGIYVGGGEVVHYSGLANGLEAGPIIQTNLDSFENGYGSYVVEHENSLPRDLIVERAKSKIGEDLYNIFTNNCEHFANWCVTGVPYSQQINHLMKIGYDCLDELGWI